MNPPVSPSAAGSLKSFIMIRPEPLASNSRLSLLRFVDMVLPEKVILFGITSVVKFKGSKAPAAGSLAPTTTLSMVPEFRSMPLICTRSALEVVTLSTLSLKLNDESIVRFDTLTTPVPPGVSLRSAFELVEIMLSLNVRLSTVIESANDVAPDTDIEPNVDKPDTSRVPVVTRLSLPKLIAPVVSVIEPLPAVNVLLIAMLEADVDKFSLPKSIVPPESVIEPFANVRLPIVEPVALVMVPVVVTFSLPKLIAPLESVIDPLATVNVLLISIDVAVVVRFSLPKLIAPLESVIDPLASVRLPNVEPVPAVIVPVVERFSFPNAIAPEESVIEPSANVILPSVDPVSAETVPVVVRFSFPKLIAPLESMMDPLPSVRLPITVPVANV